MSKPIIAAAFSALLLSAAPAFAQNTAPTLAQTPPAPSTINLGSLGKVDAAQAGAPTQPRPRASEAPAPATINLGSLGKVDAAAAPGHGKGFGGRHGAATNLRDAPRESTGTESRPAMGVLKAIPQDPAAARKPTLFMRKSGDDKRQDARPSGSGLTKSGPGALQFQRGTTATAQDSSAAECTAAGHVKVFDGRTVEVAPAGGGSRAVAVRGTGLGKELTGTLAQPGGETAAPRAQSANNLKQLGTANTCR